MKNNNNNNIWNKRGRIHTLAAGAGPRSARCFILFLPVYLLPHFCIYGLVVSHIFLFTFNSYILCNLLLWAELMFRLLCYILFYEYQKKKNTKFSHRRIVLHVYKICDVINIDCLLIDFHLGMGWGVNWFLPFRPLCERSNVNWLRKRVSISALILITYLFALLMLKHLARLAFLKQERQQTAEEKKMLAEINGLARSFVARLGWWDW